MNPILSIITVCYNSVDVIEKTIISVINQEYADYEYIVVDGSSSDGTICIINKYSKQINKIISEKDSGIYDAMNKGIKMASGKYLLFLNADDVLYSNTTLNKVCQFMDDDKYFSDIYYGDIELENEYGIYHQSPRELKLFPYKMVVSHQAVFVKKELLVDNLFDLNYRYCADYKQLSSLYMNGAKFKYMNLIITHTPLNSGATYDNYTKSIKEHFSILKERGYSVFWEEKRVLFLRMMIRALKKYIPRFILRPMLRFISRYKVV